MGNGEYKKLMEYAVKAPSGHNAQPWKFKVEGNRISIYPDYERNLPVADPENRGLFISLGCALENLLIAAEHFGYSTTVRMKPEPGSMEYIEVELFQEKQPRHHVLFHFIEARQTTRNRYNRADIPKKDLERLKGAAVQEKVLMKLLIEPVDIEPVIHLAKEATLKRFSNKDLTSELKNWIRFDRRSAERTGDGIFSATLGLPSGPRWLGSFFMDLGRNPKREALKTVREMESASGVMVFVAQEKSREAWVNLGRSFQRSALMATSLNINHTHLNEVCTEPGFCEELAELLQLKAGAEPLLVIRIGYSKKMPYSFRRPVREVLVN